MDSGRSTTRRCVTLDVVSIWKVLAGVLLSRARPVLRTMVESSCGRVWKLYWRCHPRACGKADWQLILAADGAGIVGVASGSKLVAIKRKGFEMLDAAFKNSDYYCSGRLFYRRRGAV